ncbi:TPA: hypothetical protein TXJ16_000619 [Streptococcus suis]|uniref:Uncharacterized protein n=1 Tax=Streptococcus suivaginalis TaxID=3028082 RepID=A0AA96VC62_9STRE|nr:hypothetical protein [Streptococcus sp. 29896]MBL6538579.1 hypothetical protein [Streptococcus suis]MBM7270552.1 hypothetical protein [Streptococcus suis]MBO4107450.1 hypothetical protein [Streptococcus suis]MCK4028013.1 hypothetical protein [Streptococcus suis]WNY46467.1 hypothetical protein PXH68_06105 [Streptococcus sp. 29896]
MTEQLFILFFFGILLLVGGYFVPKPIWLRRLMMALGGLMAALPFLIFLYFMILFLSM